MIYKPGQRVRKVAATLPKDRINQVPGWACPPVGTEGTVIVVHREGSCGVAFDGYPTHPNFDYWYAPIYTLAPLTDPSADSFLETVKSWGPLHEEPRKIDWEKVRELTR